MVSWSQPKPRVHSIAIELTGFCNQTCDYCYNAFRADGGASVGAPDVDVITARLARILDAVDVEHVTLTGGEPLASAALFPLLEWLRRRAVHAQMISNATLVTDSIARRLARHRLRSVLVTLNGGSAATHDALVRAPGHFDKTLAGIAALRAHRVPVEGSIVITRVNVREVGDAVERLVGLGVRTIALSRFSPAGYATDRADALLPSPDDVRAALDAAVRIARERALTLYATMPLPPCVIDAGAYPEVRFNDCPIGTDRQEFALGPRGEIRHCALHVEPIVRDALADDTDLAHALGPGDPHAYRTVRPTFCAGCEHVARCGGGCGAAAWWVAKSRNAPDPFVARAHERRRLPVLTG